MLLRMLIMKRSLIWDLGDSKGVGIHALYKPQRGSIASTSIITSIITSHLACLLALIRGIVGHCYEDSKLFHYYNCLEGLGV